MYWHKFVNQCWVHTGGRRGRSGAGPGLGRCRFIASEIFSSYSRAEIESAVHRVPVPADLLLFMLIRYVFVIESPLLILLQYWLFLSGVLAGVFGFLQFRSPSSLPRCNSRLIWCRISVLDWSDIVALNWFGVALLPIPLISPCFGFNDFENFF